MGSIPSSVHRPPRHKGTTEGDGGGGVERRADLEVHTLALVRDDEERVHGTLGAASLVRVALARQGVPFQPWLHSDVGDNGPAVATLDGDTSGLGTHTRCLDHDAWYLHQPCHVL